MITLLEFKMWLEGYIDGGGSDFSLIKEKLNHVYVPPQPQYPIPCKPDDNPFYPDQIFVTTDNTGDYLG